MRDSYAQRQHHPPVLDSIEIVVGLVLMSIAWFMWYLARERYHLANRQIGELACYVTLGLLAIGGFGHPGSRVSLPPRKTVAPPAYGGFTKA